MSEEKKEVAPKMEKGEIEAAKMAPSAPEQSLAGGDMPRVRRAGGKPKRRGCGFCMNKIGSIDYKDVGRLRKYMTEKGKIISRRQTGLCAGHQREITNAIKRARNMGLI